jgi:hypothetical protein
VLTECLWSPPASYDAESILMMSAHQGLTGLDAVFWFNLQDPGFSQPAKASPGHDALSKWKTGSGPLVLGQFPANALLFRKGYVAEAAAPVVLEQRSPRSLWRLEPPAIAEDKSFDPNRVSERLGTESAGSGGIDPLAFLAGPVVVRYGDTDAPAVVAAELSACIDRQHDRVRSVTGQITWDFAAKVFAVDTPCAQGVTGFLGEALKAGSQRLSDVTIASDNHHATVLVVSLDGRPIRESAAVLVQVGTQKRPTGWKLEPAEVEYPQTKKKMPGWRVLEYGGAPWQLEESRVRLTVRNPGLKTMVVLDANGMPLRSEPLRRGGAAGADAADAAVVPFPPEAMYVVLR